MQITSSNIPRPGHLELMLEEAGVALGPWEIRFTDLWDIWMGVHQILEAYGILVTFPGGQPKLREDPRQYLQISSIYIQDAREWALEVKERNLERNFVCGGLWYAEITINEIPTDCSFNTLEELAQIVHQIIVREAAYMIGDHKITHPDQVGHA